MYLNNNIVNGTVILSFRDVFMTLSSIYDGAFSVKIINGYFIEKESLFDGNIIQNSTEAAFPQNVHTKKN